MSQRDSFHFAGEKLRERAVLVGTALPGHNREEEEECLLELAQLARSAGAKVLHAMIQERRAPDGSTYIGKGKVEELAEICREREADLIVFDNDLSPVQARNIEKRTNTNVIDRTELILDIFSQRAKTKQARLQVELAQLEYLSPRLRRMWEHLSRQDGGIGTRGPGETQLEVDRRRLGERVSRLKRELVKIEKISTTKAMQRRLNAFTVALVGYTNVGKSSIMNALTGANVHVADALFATLDSTTRKLELGEGDSILLSDTVGFVRKLPHHLVESFKVTLSEVRDADLVIHVADFASSTCDRQIEAVDEVLGSLDIDPDRTLRVFNKIDAQGTPDSNWDPQVKWPDAIRVSAQTGEGLDELLEEIRYRHQGSIAEMIIEVPVGQESVTGKIYDECDVRDVKYEAEGTFYLVRITDEVQDKLLGLGCRLRPDRLDDWSEGN
ncbi:MAG: GTPase HflX [bacterium]|nr:GTPase HflX [bacterium]